MNFNDFTNEPCLATFNALMADKPRAVDYLDLDSYERRVVELIAGLSPMNADRLVQVLPLDLCVAAGYWMRYTGLLHNVTEARMEYHELAWDIGLVLDSLVGMMEELGGSPDDALALLEWACDTIDHRDEKDALRRSEYGNRGRNRGEYGDHTVAKVYEQKSGNQRFRADQDIRCQGLLARVLFDQYGHQSEPVHFGIVNCLPPTPYAKHDDISQEFWGRMNNMGIMVVAERLALNTRMLGVKEHLSVMFPLAKDLAAYVRSFTSPVLPQGYWPKCTVRFQRLSVDGQDLQTDGSGWFNIDHPDAKEFVAKYGICGFQIRGKHNAGLVCKGAVRPRRLGPNTPLFVLDLNQIKAAKKSMALGLRDQDQVVDYPEVDMGCIQVWNRKGYLSSGFEVLENIKMTPRSCAIIETRCVENQQRFAERGPAGLFQMLCQDDLSIQRIGQLGFALKSAGLDFDPLAIPRVREAAHDKLGRIMWKMEQGAGVAFPRYLCILDSTVEPGTIVVPGIEPGTPVAGFRFPIVLSQGLIVPVIAEAKDHMLVDGELVPWIAFMNPQDLTVRCQGDDDGDIIGISTDKDMVELFSYRIDNRVFHIEPKGTPDTTLTDSPEGWEFIRHDQRGCVGLCTVWRSRLLAVGDIMGANAMSISIQENIDCAKRAIQWTDPRQACEIENWDLVGGEYHSARDGKPLMPFPAKDMVDGKFPEKLVRKWVQKRLVAAGCWELAEGRYGTYRRALNPIAGWRFSDKKVIISEWGYCHQRQAYKGGNLVHFCNDVAYREWERMADIFGLNSPPQDLADLLPEVLRIKGHMVQVQDLTWDEYSRGRKDNPALRERAGIVQMGQRLGQIQELPYEMEDAQQARLAVQQAAEARMQELTLDELATIWVQECKNEQGNVNHAFRAICFEGSKVMELLGLVDEDQCKFLDREDRLDRLVDVCLLEEDPFDRLSKIVWGSTLHAEECVDQEGEPIEGKNCPCCLERLQTALVTAIREDKKRVEHNFVRWLIPRLNGRVRY